MMSLDMKANSSPKVTDEIMNVNQKRVFVSTTFDEKGMERAALVEALLDFFGLRCHLGDISGGEMAKGTRERIECSLLVLPILSRQLKVDEETWTASERVWQELTYAKKVGKACLVLVEKGVRLDGGILGNVEYLRFDPDGFADVLIPLGCHVRALLNRNMLTADLESLPVYSYVSDEPLDGDCSGDDVKLLILEVRHLAKQKRYEEALMLAKKATSLAPKCWRSLSSLGALHVQLDDVDEGEKIFARVLEDFAQDKKAAAAAWHNLGWVREIRGGSYPGSGALREQSDYYETALKLDPSRVNTRACLLIIKYLLREDAEAASLLEESVMFEGFLDSLRFEFDERGAQAHYALQCLPKWLRHLLYPVRRNGPGGDEY